MDVVWVLGWYKTKRHAVSLEVVTDPTLRGKEVQAICPQGWGYPNGYKSRQDSRYDIPAADTPEVMAHEPCKHCLRLLEPAKESS